MTILSLVLILGVCPLVQADDNKAEIELKVKIVAPPPPDRGGGVTAYYLRVDLWDEDFKTRVTSAGEVKADLEAVSPDGTVTLRIAKGVLAQTEDEQRLRKIKVLPMAEPPLLPENGYIIGIAYDFSPDGATFDPAIELEMRYDPFQIPDGIEEKDLLIAYYDEKWLELDSVVDTVGNTITTGKVNHFTAFAILGYRVVEAPAAFTVSKLIISPAEVDIGQSVTSSVIVTNTGGETGSYKVTFKIDGVVEDTKEVTISAGASKKVTFTTAKDVAGSYAIDVNGLSDSFVVKAAPPPPAPSPPLTPIPTPELPAEPFNWALVGGIIAGVVLTGLGVFFWVRRKPA